VKLEILERRAARARANYTNGTEEKKRTLSHQRTDKPPKIAPYNRTNDIKKARTKTKNKYGKVSSVARRPEKGGSGA
jgi:hypothetical protein